MNWSTLKTLVSKPFLTQKSARSKVSGSTGEHCYEVLVQADQTQRKAIRSEILLSPWSTNGHSPLIRSVEDHVHLSVTFRAISPFGAQEIRNTLYDKYGERVAKSEEDSLEP